MNRAGAVMIGAVSSDLVRLRVSLRDVKPTPWRRIVVPTAIMLDDLHAVIQAVMGWEVRHLWCFRLNGIDYGPETGRDPRVPLGEFRLRAGERFSYVYDFGDWWEHDLRVELAAQTDIRGAVPRCVAGGGTCPPEDCGGPARYAEATAEAFSLSADIDMEVIADFAEQLVTGMRSSDLSELSSDPERLENLQRAMRRIEWRLRLVEPFDRRAANDTIRGLSGANEEIRP